MITLDRLGSGLPRSFCWEPDPPVRSSPETARSVHSWLGAELPGEFRREPGIPRTPSPRPGEIKNGKTTSVKHVTPIRLPPLSLCLMMGCVPKKPNMCAVNAFTAEVQALRGCAVARLSP